MNIELRRTDHRPGSTEGQIWIDGMKICDTAENAKTALPPGTYPIVLVRCRQYARKMPVIIVPGSGQCQECKRHSFANINTTMPTVCHMLKPGNGVHHRADGSIIVGKRLAPGCLIHPRQAFDTLYERIRKNVERGKAIAIAIAKAGVGAEEGESDSDSDG